LHANDNLDSVITELRKTNKTYILQVDTAQRSAFSRLKQYSARSFYFDGTIIGVLFTGKIETCEVRYSQEAVVHTLKNVAGILPGKSKKEELVIFSAHYDHLGIGKPNAANDSIFNGANDDASGTTAVIMLANYFSRLKNNERTIIFVAFTAEELGGFGSQYFSRQVDPDKVMAMVNIELIGTESKWGSNSAFVTGYEMTEMTDMGKMLQQHLEGTNFTFYPDPYPEQQLFYRSDNATLAQLGVPAHTISTSKMDSEKFYHTQDDEIETLDIKNMTAIIRAIAISSRGIVAGRDTPLRVDKTAIR
jgi:Zn-dependent M28 family amino/carboxypeptidase